MNLRRPPKYTRGFIDRHGKPRWYFRREGHESIALPGLPWSPEFMAAYEDAMGGATAPRIEVGAGRTMPGTFDALIVRFYSSSAFKSCSKETQRNRRNIIERFRVETLPNAKFNNGRCRVAHLNVQHVEQMMSARANTPAAARNFKKTLHSLLQFAIAEGMRTDDPTERVKAPRPKRDSGFRTWTEEHIAAFVRQHPIGTRARMALALLLYTAQRRGDVVRMGRQHVKGDLIWVRQNKTGAELEIPIHPELRAIIAATPAKHLTFLTTDFSKPFTPAGFGNWFRDCCKAANLEDGLSAHGLRKAACRRLAEAGCSASQIMAISGHRSLSEAEKYVRAANQVRLARAAMAATYPSASETGTQIGKPDDGFANQQK